MKKKTDYYKKLKKIKRPVLLVIGDRKTKETDRVRILFPDGSVIFSYADEVDCDGDFYYSCFSFENRYVGISGEVAQVPTFTSVEHLLRMMKRYDRLMGLTILNMEVC